MMLASLPGAQYVLVALWLMNGDPMQPMGLTVIPGEPSFATWRECMAVAHVDYAGAVDPQRGKVACVPVSR